ncbi:MAG TPA: ribbon-helix-helix protein, CopG family [Thermoanaerobaculia bacterium]|nr:ribbon-helix-helix protein, CopG family [Thermoanaerobaculia bacterium]
MRTTLTLDESLARELKKRAAATGRPFKDVVNEAIARGLAGGTTRVKRYRLRPVSLGGAQEGVDLTKAVRLAAALEDEEWARKLALRK